MNYIENVYVCLAAPLLIAILCTKEHSRRSMLFLLGGMTVCLLSSYISTFLAITRGANAVFAAVEIAPVVEEAMKLMPVLFYVLVFEPKKEHVAGCILMVSIGFATFENVCFLIENGAASILQLLIRGFGTGAMHVVCGAILSSGMMYLWDRLWLRVAGSIGLLSFTIIFHGIYNILVLQTGVPAVIGYLIPLGITAAGVAINRSSLRKHFN